MSQRPSIRQLEYAVAVAETLHFGRAARQCAVTQPALSAQIQQLEDLLGVQIFERSRRKVIVTPEGAQVLEKAREALASIDDLVARAEGAAEPLSGPLRLGVIPTVAPYLLPPLLPSVRERHPALQLLLREEQTARLVEHVEAGPRRRAAPAAGRRAARPLALPVDEADLVELPLFEEPFWFVAPETHPLMKPKPARIREEALQGAEVLLLEDGHCLRAQALSVCQRAGAVVPGRIQATSLSTLVQMVANDLGVTLLPEHALEVEVRPGMGLAAKRFRDPAPRRTIGLAWRRGAAREADFQLLGASLEKAMAGGRGRARST